MRTHQLTTSPAATARLQFTKPAKVVTRDHLKSPAATDLGVDQKTVHNARKARVRSRTPEYHHSPEVTGSQASRRIRQGRSRHIDAPSGGRSRHKQQDRKQGAERRCYPGNT